MKRQLLDRLAGLEKKVGNLYYITSVSPDLDYLAVETEKSRKSIKKAKSLESIQEQFNLVNCIYEINYVHDLQGGILNIPSDCALTFKGGNFINGAVYFDETTILTTPDLVTFNAIGNIFDYQGYKMNAIEMYSQKDNTVKIRGNAVPAIYNFTESVRRCKLCGVNEFQVILGVKYISATEVDPNVITGYGPNNSERLENAVEIVPYLISEQIDVRSLKMHGLRNDPVLLQTVFTQVSLMLNNEYFKNIESLILLNEALVTESNPTDLAAFVVLLNQFKTAFPKLTVTFTSSGFNQIKVTNFNTISILNDNEVEAIGINLYPSVASLPVPLMVNIQDFKTNNRLLINAFNLRMKVYSNIKEILVTEVGSNNTDDGGYKGLGDFGNIDEALYGDAAADYFKIVLADYIENGIKTLYLWYIFSFSEELCYKVKENLKSIQI